MPGTNASGSIFVALNASAEGAAPTKIQILPPGPVIVGIDGRRYVVKDMLEVAQASLNVAGGKLPIDENHAIDVAAPQGQPSPARAWIVGLNAQSDGLWADVEWTEAGR